MCHIINQKLIGSICQGKCSDVILSATTCSTVMVTATLITYVMTSLVTSLVNVVDLGDPMTHHLKRVSLTAAPKRTLWFCQLCYSTGDAVDKKKTAKTKVSMCQRSYSIATAYYLLFAIECQDTDG